MTFGEACAEFLTDVRAYFAEHGGLKGAMSDNDGNVCANGAIQYVYWGSRFLPVMRESTEKLVADVAREQFPERAIPDLFAPKDYIDVGTIAAFNDDEATTKDEVLAVFDKAIVNAQGLV